MKLTLRSTISKYKTLCDSLPQQTDLESIKFLSQKQEKKNINIDFSNKQTFFLQENRKPTSKKKDKVKTNVKDIYTEYKYVDSNEEP
jgi:hypothetical protein